MNRTSTTIFAALTAGMLLVGPAAMAASASEIEQDPTVYAEITGYAPHSPENNHPETWCEGGVSIEPGGSSYVLTEDYEQVVVKAGSGAYANTIFGASPEAGETVWADTNGNGTYDPGGQNGDKEISHIILCPVPEDEVSIQPVPNPESPDEVSIQPVPNPESPDEVSIQPVPNPESPDEVSIQPVPNPAPTDPETPDEVSIQPVPNPAPTDPENPTTPVDPTEPEVPVEPVDPTEPTVPSQPVVPVEGGQGGGSDEELAFTGLPAGVLALTGLGLVGGGALAMRKANSQ